MNLAMMWAPVEEWRFEVYFEGNAEGIGKPWKRWQAYS